MMKSTLALGAAALAIAIAARAEPGISKDTIKLGSYLPLQSGLAAGATQMKEGTEAYFRWVNDQGGVNGRKIEWIVENDSYNPQQTVAVVKKLVEGELVEIKAAEAVTQRVRQRMMEELTVEDRLNDEVREILTQHQDEMRRTGVSYQEMYKKVKGQLARDRKLVLR